MREYIMNENISCARIMLKTCGKVTIPPKRNTIVKRKVIISENNP